MTMVQPDTPLTDVLKLLLDAGVSALPVVDVKAWQGPGYKACVHKSMPHMLHGSVHVLRKGASCVPGNTRYEQSVSATKVEYALAVPYFHGASIASPN
jgi:hypothetical protein